MRSGYLVACLAALLIAPSMGCKPKRGQTAAAPAPQSDEEQRLRQLEAEMARIRAEMDRIKRAPTGLSAASRRDLERTGIGVTEDAEGITLTLPNTILFRSGSADLQPAAKRALDQAAKTIKGEFSGANLVVRGHTDNQPIKHSAHKFTSNQHLSEVRAQTVANYLKKAGVRNPTAIVGYADTKPVADNSTAAGRQKNRRVEILVASGASGRAAPRYREAPGSLK